MRDDQKGPIGRAGSADRKTRIDGDRVIHTTNGVPFHGDQGEPPRGLTAEQAEAQRSGFKLDERQTREAAQGDNQSTASGSPDHQRRPPTEHPERDKTDDVTDPPYGRKLQRTS